MGGERKVVNIRIDEKPYRATKPVLKRYFGSVCAAIEPYLASIYSIATTTNLSETNGVIPSITVDIGNMNIRRHMRPRRKFLVETENLDVSCHYCEKLSVDKFEYVPCNETYDLCSFHADYLLKSGDWKVTS